MRVEERTLSLWTVRTGNVRRLRKYVEWMSRGRRTDRIAFVMKEWDLPLPLPGAEWQPDATFNPADELLGNPDLKTVFEEALEKGVVLYLPHKSSSQVDLPDNRLR